MSLRDGARSVPSKQSPIARGDCSPAPLALPALQSPKRSEWEGKCATNAVRRKCRKVRSQHLHLAQVQVSGRCAILRAGSEMDALVLLCGT